MTALRCRDKLPGQKNAAAIWKGNSNINIKSLDTFERSFLFCRSFRAGRWVHAELARSSVTRTGQLTVGTARMPVAPHCCRQTDEVTVESHPKTASWLRISRQNWARASVTSASRRWGCPSSQYRPARWDTHLAHSHSSCSAKKLRIALLFDVAVHD